MMKMTNREYKRFLLEDTTRTVRLSYFMLLGDCVELVEENDSIFDGARHIEQEIIKTAASMEQILKKDTVDKQTNLDRMAELKNDLTSIFREAGYVKRRMRILRQYLNILRSGSVEWNELYEEPASMPEILEDCTRYVTAQKDESMIDRAAFIMSLFPLKMTRERYYDYIRHAIDHYYGSTPDYMKKTIEKELKPELLVMTEYDKESIFASINERIMEIWTSAHEATDLESYEEFPIEAKDILSAWDDRLFIIFESINYCIIVLRYATDMDFLLGDDFICRDVSAAFVEHVGSNNIELFAEAMGETLDEIAGEWLGKRYEGQRHKLNAPENNLPEDIKGIRLTQVIVDQLFDEIPSQHISKVFNDEGADEIPGQDDEQDAEKALDAFMDCMKEYLSKESPKKQRVIKQNFLARVPCGFNQEEWSDYIEYVYRSADEQQRRLICRYVYDTFDDLYFSTRYMRNANEEEE